MFDYTYDELGATVGQSSGSPIKDMLNGAIDFACGLNAKYPDGIFNDPISQDISRNSPQGIIRREIIDFVCGQAGRPQPPTGSFTGGQCAAFYRFRILNYPIYDGVLVARGVVGTEMSGPITSITYITFENNQFKWEISNAAGLTYIYSTFPSGSNTDGSNPPGPVTPERTDGQPDNCGNLSSTTPGPIPNGEKSGYITITDKDGNVIQIPVNFDPDINGDLKVDLDGTEIIFGKDGVSIKQKSGQGDPEGWDKKDPIDEKTPRERLKDIEEDLKQAQEDIDKLSEILGIDEYPLSLPESLISKDEGFFGNLIPNNNISIPNLTRFLAWYVERFDEIVGQWEIPIEIKDTDPTTPGDQQQTIKLPNLAEAIGEMFTLSFQSYINSEVLLNFALRNLIETGTDKQQNFITYKLLQSLTDWVGFKQKDIALEMPLTFTTNKTRYDEILKESTVKVSCVEFDEKFGLEADLMRFRKAASILDSVYFRKINPNGDIKQQILDYLLKTYNDVNKVTKNDDKLEELFNKIENGFTDIPTVGDPTQPYDRPYNQRPRIKNLSDLDDTPNQ